MMVKYEDFVREEEKIMRGIYQHAGQMYPTANIAAEVNSESLKKGRDIELSPAVEQLAQELLAGLEAAYQIQISRGI